MMGGGRGGMMGRGSYYDDQQMMYEQAQYGGRGGMRGGRGMMGGPGYGPGGMGGYNQGPLGFGGPGAIKRMLTPVSKCHAQGLRGNS